MEKNEVIICLKQQNVALAVLIDRCQSYDIYKKESTWMYSNFFLVARFLSCSVQLQFFLSIVFFALRSSQHNVDILSKALKFQNDVLPVRLEIFG